MALLETPDYDQAVAAFLRVATESLMADADPVYASLRRIPRPEGVGTVQVQVEGARISSPEIRLVTHSEIEPADVLAGNLEQFYVLVAQIADEHLVQLMRPYYAHVGDAAEAVGNTMTLDGVELTRLRGHLVDAV